MSDKKIVSEESLNALVDNEFAPHEKADLMAQASADKALAEQLCELRHLKDLVQTAYADIPVSAGVPTAPTKVGLRRLATLVASILMAVGVALWLWQPWMQADANRFVLLEPPLQTTQEEHAVAEMRIVFHLNNPDRRVATTLLDDIEWTLQRFRNQARPLRIEVVAHGEGLWLLREGLSVHQARIEALAQRYDNLSFVACQNTLDRLQVEDGLEITLLPAAQRTPSGVAYVIRLQQAGWAYIRV